MFIPTTPEELEQHNWSQLDIILITGDTYIDSPQIGIAVIGKILLKNGYKVGIIAQPDINSEKDITRLGEPRLFWGVTGGSIDSMVANYTALKKYRKQDDYTPGAYNNRRPDRAVILYTNLIRQHFKNTVPIVLGGIEASMRRITHYDYWSDKLRRPILFDAKADFLIYGMAERTIVELADTIQVGKDPRHLRGICYISDSVPKNYLILPSFETVTNDKRSFIDMFHDFYKNSDPLNATGLTQKIGTRFLVQNPPQLYLNQKEMDEIYAMDFERSVHPYYAKQGKVRALDTIKFSINSHRGCYGECNFCSIGVHEGRTIRWRSEQSILNEARQLSELPDFRGTINDIGGPTANMYGFECHKKLKNGACKDKRCLYPEKCSQLPVYHNVQIDLLKKLRQIPGIKHIFIGSGIRFDMVIDDRKYGKTYLKDVAEYHTSGQMKIAPEHSVKRVLDHMGKPGIDTLLEFKRQFDRFSESAGKRQFLTYYLIAAHPGCTEEDMHLLKTFAVKELHINPEQVQIYTPLPSTYSSLMYYTGRDPFTMKKLSVVKDINAKNRQKSILTSKTPIPYQKRTHKHG
ncbi:MAG: YgiQ family radical SAM protein [Candidatus Marinimicrobia bacterium]|nr:YgiQ family radical SAM protein [Candidatus Neomarinimicrobiota bacterium]